MSDLISRQDAIDALIKAFADAEDGDEKVECGAYWYHGTVMSIIKSLPSADAVEVVRCKDCKHGHKQIEHEGKLFYQCDYSECEEWFTGNFFCANGERREP